MIGQGLTDGELADQSGKPTGAERESPVPPEDRFEDRNPH
jgi:hypothetical protein